MKRKRGSGDFFFELEAHIRLEADRYREKGLSEEEALAAARRGFGNLTRTQERFYESRRWLWWDSLHQDLRFAVRLLTKTPGWSVIAALTVALGIGAAAAMFSIVNTVLLRPLPFPHPAQLYSVLETTKFGEMGLAPDYFTIRENLSSNSAIRDMGAFDSSGVNWTGADQAERLVAGQVTASFFSTLRVQPVYGRTFLPQEDKPGADKVVLLSYSLWQRRFGGNSAIVGQKIRLDRAIAQVVGIMPRWFDYPQGSDLWIPLALDEAQQRQRRAMRIVDMVARANPSATPSDINQELNRLTALVTNEYPETYKRQGFLQTIKFVSQPLQQHLTGDMRPALLVFSGAVALMLMIVCFTVANLMLARATSRRREIAVRVALGSPRRRIVGQLLTESLLISLLGGGIGLGLAMFAIRALNAMRQTALAGLPEVAIDSSTAIFALLVTVLTGVAFGLAPALGSLGFGVREVLQGESRTASGGAGVRRARQILVVAQLGLSLTLAIGAGLLAKSFYRLRIMDPGFNPANVLTARINMTGPSYVSLDRQREFMEALLQQVRSLPGVESASVGAIPAGGTSGNRGVFIIENRPLPPAGQAPLSDFIDVSADYFRTLGVPLIEGRLLTPSDSGDAPLDVVINQAFVRKFFPGEDPLGHRISTKSLDSPDRGWAEIVGVVGDIHQAGLDRDVTPSFYRTIQQEHQSGLSRSNLLIRVSKDPAALIPALERTVAGIDRDQPVYDAKTLEQRLADSLGPRRFDAALSGDRPLPRVDRSLRRHVLPSYAANRGDRNPAGFGRAARASRRADFA